jgi:hypothetical protein
MASKIFKTLSILVLLQLMVGCASFAPALSTEVKADPGTGYVFGRFKSVSLPNSFFSLRLALNLEEQNKLTNYLIKFDKEDATTAIAVKPGIYNLNKLLVFFGMLGDNNMNKRETTLTKGPLTIEFTIESGKAYYIADFLGQTNVTQSYNQETLTWKLESVKDNYENTTLDFKNRYPNLRELEVFQAIKFK